MFSIWKKNRNFPEYIQQYLDQEFVIPAKSELDELSFAVIDAETTGLEKSDQLITLGGLTMRNYGIDLGNCLDQKYEYSNSSEAAAIHEELPEMLNQNLDERFEEALTFLSNKIIVGHHIAFDIGKINQTIASKYPGFKLRNKVLDTFQLMVRLDPEKYERQVGGRHALQLDEICDDFGIAVENRHTALGDAYMTAQVLMFLLARLEDRGVRFAGELLR
jgi:DNA polymerase-3 subunit epsilon